jgi:hypothetical protein
LFGNRGCLHDRNGVIGSSDRPLWTVRRWITCLLRYKDWRRPLNPPGGYTGLFFLDEATALAAGHRPCALCRRADYNAYRQHGGVAALGADALDLHLHAERLNGRKRRLHPTPWRELAIGAIVSFQDAPHLCLADALLPWRPDGYGAALPRPTAGDAIALTPPTSQQALRAGFAIKLDRSAAAFA